MLEVISSAQFARRHKLRSSGDGGLVVDGPDGFELVIQVVGGSPVSYSRALGGTGMVAVGSQITAKSRIELHTAGDRSVVDVFDPKAA